MKDSSKDRKNCSNAWVFQVSSFSYGSRGRHSQRFELADTYMVWLSIEQNIAADSPEKTISSCFIGKRFVWSGNSWDRSAFPLVLPSGVHILMVFSGSTSHGKIEVTVVGKSLPLSLLKVVSGVVIKSSPVIIDLIDFGCSEISFSCDRFIMCQWEISSAWQGVRCFRR